MSENKKEGNVVKTEEQKLGEYAGQGLRGPRFGIFEQLLCQHLVQATVTTDPLRKIQLICEGCLMVSVEKRKALVVDMEKLEVVRAVTEALQHKVTTNLKGKNTPVVSVKFGFATSEENYIKYIEPWWKEEGLHLYPRFISQKLGTTYRRYFCSQCHNLVADDLKGKIGFTKNDKCKYCGSNLDDWHNPQPFFLEIGFKANEDVPYWRLFFGYCQALTPLGYATLENPYLQWAMPFSMELMQKLTQVVRPEIYNEIAKMFLETRRREKSEG